MKTLTLRRAASRLPPRLKSQLNNFKVWWIKRGHIGKGTYLDPSVQVLGWSHVQIGHHTMISEGTWLNVNQRVPGNISIVIGDNCFIGRRNFVTAGECVRLGSYTATGINCQFIGAGHRYGNPFMPYLKAEVESYGSIIIGANCWLTNSISVLGNVTIGFGSVIGANSVVLQPLPPLCLAVGNPARVIKLFDLKTQQWVNAPERDSELSSTIEKHCAMLMSEGEYLRLLGEQYPALHFPHAVAGIRGGQV